MKKSIALVAVFLAVFAVNANAGQLTVANTDLTLAGGVSATYNYMSDTDDPDNFNVDDAIVHLFKNPTADSPVGGHLAFGTFHVKTPTGQHVIPDIGYGEFSPWLAYFSWMPVENMTIDAGLLWHKFGGWIWASVWIKSYKIQEDNRCLYMNTNVGNVAT